ncbi:MAG: T9SS type A sorting domain-containing protein [Bacteroidia bacterium]|nr:T9SS type A sorting domain-containing protein [Bacteroidia bacterium]
MKIRLLSIAIMLSIFAGAQPSVTCDSVLQLGTCAGSQVIVPFTVTGGSFSFGNQFKVQLSDQWGNWGNPVQIGQMTWFTSGIIFATLPQNVNFGFFYRVRIIATNPVDTSNNSPNTIFVTQSAFLNSLQALPNDTACWGDTVSVGPLMPGASYSWNTGDTTQFIDVTAPGQYICTTSDMLNCTSEDTINIVFISCNPGMNEWVNSNNFHIYPNPARSWLYTSWIPGTTAEGKLLISDLSGRTLFVHEIRSGTDVLSLHGMTPGMYLVTLISDYGSDSRRLIIE